MTAESRMPPNLPTGGAPKRRSWRPKMEIGGGHGIILVEVTPFGREFVLVPTIIFVGGLISLGFCLVSTVLALPAAVVAFWPWFAGVMEYPLARAVTVIGLALFAVCLYGVRHAKRVTYGYGEVAVGIIGLWAALNRLDADRMAVGLGIAASVYVIVRGMVNIEDGRKAEREEEANRARTATTEEPPAPVVPNPEERPPGEPGA